MGKRSFLKEMFQISVFLHAIIMQKRRAGSRPATFMKLLMQIHTKNNTLAEQCYGAKIKSNPAACEARRGLEPFPVSFF